MKFGTVSRGAASGAYIGADGSIAFVQALRLMLVTHSEFNSVGDLDLTTVRIVGEI